MATYRTEADGRLFPSKDWDHGWRMSAQADTAGYQCSPNKCLNTLEEYDTVEVVLYGPFRMDVDPTTLDLPLHVLAKFTDLESNGVAIGCHLTKEDLEHVETAVLRASMNPNAGIPKGTVGWRGRSVFHGASSEDAQDIEVTGVSMDKSAKGYFGQAFYVAEDKELALSNYADFSGDEDGGTVLEFSITDEARILDLRNPVDAEQWQQSGLDKQLGDQHLARKAASKGIDGVYDRSVGGLAIYNPEVIQCLGPIYESSAALKP